MRYQVGDRVRVCLKSLYEYGETGVVDEVMPSGILGIRLYSEPEARRLYNVACLEPVYTSYIGRRIRRKVLEGRL